MCCWLSNEGQEEQAKSFVSRPESPPLTPMGGPSIGGLQQLEDSRELMRTRRPFERGRRRSISSLIGSTTMKRKLATTHESHPSLTLSEPRSSIKKARRALDPNPHSAIQLESLSEELILHCLSYLGYDDLLRVTEVSRHFSRLGNDDQVSSVIARSLSPSLLTAPKLRRLTLARTAAVEAVVRSSLYESWEEEENDDDEGTRREKCSVRPINGYIAPT